MHSLLTGWILLLTAVTIKASNITTDSILSQSQSKVSYGNALLQWKTKKLSTAHVHNKFTIEASMTTPFSTSTMNIDEHLNTDTTAQVNNTPHNDPNKTKKIQRDMSSSTIGDINLTTSLVNRIAYFDEDKVVPEAVVKSSENHRTEAMENPSVNHEHLDHNALNISPSVKTLSSSIKYADSKLVTLTPGTLNTNDVLNKHRKELRVENVIDASKFFNVNTSNSGDRLWLSHHRPGCDDHPPRPLPPSLCGGVYRGARVMILSPNFPRPYPGSAQCIYTILPPGYEGPSCFQVSFVHLSLRWSPNCELDWLQIGDLQPRLCGGLTGNKVYQVTGPLRVFFRSGASPGTDGSGFGLYISLTSCGEPLPPLSTLPPYLPPVAPPYIPPIQPPRPPPLHPCSSSPSRCPPQRPKPPPFYPPIHPRPTPPPFFPSVKPPTPPQFYPPIEHPIPPPFYPSPPHPHPLPTVPPYLPPVKPPTPPFRPPVRPPHYCPHPERPVPTPFYPSARPPIHHPPQQRPVPSPIDPPKTWWRWWWVLRCEWGGAKYLPPGSCPSQPPAVLPPETCGRVFSAPSIHLSSEQWLPHLHTSKTNQRAQVWSCRLVILKANPGTCGLQLNLKRFSLRCGAEYLEVAGQRMCGHQPSRDLSLDFPPNGEVVVTYHNVAGSVTPGHFLLHARQEYDCQPFNLYVNAERRQENNIT